MSFEDFFSLESLSKWGIGDFSYTENLNSLTYSHYDKALKENLIGNLNYLKGEKGQMRKNLALFFPEVQSALTFLFPYKKNLNSKRIGAFYSGFKDKDYHRVLKLALEEIRDKLKEFFPDIKTKISIDSGAVLEKDLAYRSGLGSFGKNTLIIHKKWGTFHVLGTIFLSLKLPLNEKEKIPEDLCGDCSLCVDACPTKALLGDKRLCASRCVSYFTLENVSETEKPNEYKNQTYRAGCDLCQISCPHNEEHLFKGDLSPLEKKFDFSDEELFLQFEKMSSKELEAFFEGTSFVRIRKKNLLKNFK